MHAISEKRLRVLTGSKGRVNQSVHAGSHSICSPLSLAKQLAWALGNIDGVFFEHLEGNDVEHARVRRTQHDECRLAVNVRAQEVRCRHAPLVPRHKTRKTILGHGCPKVIANRSLMIEKLLGDDCADRVTAEIFRASSTTAITEETGQRVMRTWLKFASKDILVIHDRSREIRGKR